MRLSDWVILMVSGAGLFVSGLVWRPVFGDHMNLKDALESTSYIATAVAALVAIYTLNAWKYQFKHAERFKSINDLKEASFELSAYIVYLQEFYLICANSLTNGGRIEAQQSTEDAQVRWSQALDRYGRVWTTARIFLSDNEVKNFVGKPEEFKRRFTEDPIQLVTSLNYCAESEMHSRLYSCFQQINQESWDLYKLTLSQVEDLLKNSR